MAGANLDLIENFNYLIGLRVLHIAAPQEFSAQLKCIEDLEIPTDQKTKQVIDGKINLRTSALSADNNVFWFRKVEGWLRLKNRINSRDFEFDTIYVNGSNSLPNLKLDDENWKVRLIEEEFHKKMWEWDDERTRNKTYSQ